MDKVINEIKFYSPSNIYYSDDIFDEELIKSIDECDTVYAFKTQDHFNEKNELIKWLLEQPINTTNEIKLLTSNGEQILASIDNNKIIFVKIDEKNRIHFFEKFKFSINNIKNDYGYFKKNKPYYIDNPLYDQYDYLFSKKNVGILFTDIHSGTIIVNNLKKCIKKI